MKLSRIAASGAGIALIAASTFAGVAANAEDVDSTVGNPVPAETSPYSAGWFAGDGGSGTAVQSAAGLTITAGGTGYQLLNGDPVNGAAISLAAAIDFPQVSTVGAEAFLQISVFGEPGAEFTTLRPVDAADPYGDWTTSQSVAGLIANDPYSKDALISALDGGANPAQVLAFGVFVNAGETSTVRAIRFGDNTFFFAAKPTLTASPTSLTLADVTKPITLTGAGFAPGEIVFLSVGYGFSGDGLGEVEADENGAFTFTFSFDSSRTEVEATFGASDSSGVFFAAAPFSVVANPIAPAAALPATGVDSTGILLAGGVLLLAGAGVAVATMRRKAAA